MKRKSLIFIILVSVVLLLTTSAIYAERTISLENINITLPNQYSTGEYNNLSNMGLFRNTTDSKNSFILYVYNNYTQNYVNFVGYVLTKGHSQNIEISGHPAVFIAENNSYRGKITHIIFESNGNLVYLSLPHSYALTDTGRNIVASTPPSLYTSDEFYRLIEQTKTDYETHVKVQDIIDNSYDSGYYGGYSHGYDDGIPRGLLSNMFWRIGL